MAAIPTQPMMACWQRPQPTPDPAARMGLLQKAEQKGVAEDLCVVPLLFYSYHSVVSDSVKGWEPNVMDIHPTRFMSK